MDADTTSDDTCQGDQEKLDGGRIRRSVEQLMPLRGPRGARARHVSGLDPPRPRELLRHERISVRESWCLVNFAYLLALIAKARGGRQTSVECEARRVGPI